jgi:hypothetical protein
LVSHTEGRTQFQGVSEHVAEDNVWTCERELVGGWKIFAQLKERHNIYTSPNIIREITLRKMSCAGHVARVREMRNACRYCIGKL